MFPNMRKYFEMEANNNPVQFVSSSAFHTIDYTDASEPSDVEVGCNFR